MQSRDDVIIDALTELSVTLGAEFSEARHIGYIRAFEGQPLHAIRWACVEVLKHHLYPTMPTPGVIVKLAGSCPPLKKIGSPYNSQQIAEYTVAQVEDAKRHLQNIASSLSDSPTA